jgi:energy-coupling factor transporter ATP-binding protein EcfA2
MILTGRPLLATSRDAPLFVDREEELQVVKESVERGTNVLVLGERGSGKTSFLHRATSMMQETGRRPLFIEGSLATTPYEFLSLIRYRVDPERGFTPIREQLALFESALAERLRPSRVMRPAGVPGESERLLDLIADLREALEERREEHVILVDELSSPEIVHTIFGRLRDEVWQLRATWVVAGNPKDEALFLRPPADAFFMRVVKLRRLSEKASFDLLRRRIPRREASDRLLRVVAKGAHGNPRRLISLATEALISHRDPAELLSAFGARDAVLEELGTPARRVVDELETHGPASASDPDFLSRLGWTRGRAAQILNQLETAGLVRATEEPAESGRPRRVFALKPL